MAIVEQVEIHLQDFIFGVGASQIAGDLRFELLAFQRIFHALSRRHKDVAGKLHGNGAGARNNFALFHILQSSAGHAHRVDAQIGKEGGVFYGDGGLNEIG